MENNQKGFNLVNLNNIYTQDKNFDSISSGSLRQKNFSKNSKSESGAYEYETIGDSLKQENEKVSLASLIKNEFYNLRNQHIEDNNDNYDNEETTFENGRINKEQLRNSSEKKSKESLEFSDSKENLQKSNQSNKLYDKLNKNLSSLESSQKGENKFGFNTKTVSETDNDSNVYQTGGFNNEDQISFNEDFSFSKDMIKETIGNDTTAYDMDATLPSTFQDSTEDIGRIKLMKELLSTDETTIHDDKQDQHKNFTKYFFIKLQIELYFHIIKTFQ